MDPNSRIYAEGHNLLGAIKIQNGDLDTALEAFQKSLSAWIQAGDQYQINRVEDNIRTTLYYLGDIANLRKAEDASVHYWEEFPNRIELAMALTNRGLVYGLDGEHGMAIKLHTRAIEISDLLGVPRIQAMTRVNIAGSYLSLEKFDEAENHLQKSMEARQNMTLKSIGLTASDLWPRSRLDVNLAETQWSLPWRLWNWLAKAKNRWNKVQHCVHWDRHTT
jgi:tetratricopeptide (TPR) repeat protein